LGATVIEKHFTLNRVDGGVDSGFSMEPAEMAQLLTETERAWQALGHVSYGPTEAEKKSLVYRRSLYITQDMKKGESFTQHNLRAIRPGYGLAPKHIGQFIGKCAAKDICRGTAVTWAMLDTSN